MADFEAHAADFAAEAIDVVAASVDTIDDARRIVDAHRLTFPVGHGLDAKRIAEKFGSFYAEDDERPYLHPVDYILTPESEILSATYSTHAVGRLTAEDALALCRWAKKKRGG